MSLELSENSISCGLCVLSCFMCVKYADCYLMNSWNHWRISTFIRWNLLGNLWYWICILHVWLISAFLCMYLMNVVCIFWNYLGQIYMIYFVIAIWSKPGCSLHYVVIYAWEVAFILMHISHGVLQLFSPRFLCVGICHAYLFLISFNAISIITIFFMYGYVFLVSDRSAWWDYVASNAYSGRKI